MLLLSLDNGGGAIIIAILPPFQSRAHHPSLILYGNPTCFIHNVALIVVEQMYHKHSKQVMFMKRVNIIIIAFITL